MKQKIKDIFSGIWFVIAMLIVFFVVTNILSYLTAFEFCLVVIYGLLFWIVWREIKRCEDIRL